jgi:hypothetical protein
MGRAKRKQWEDDGAVVQEGEEVALGGQVD